MAKSSPKRVFNRHALRWKPYGVPKGLRKQKAAIKLVFDLYMRNAKLSDRNMLMHAKGDAIMDKGENEEGVNFERNA
jgi:hypothetical protein